MPVMFANAIEGQHDYLVDNIELLGLWPKLLDAKILNAQQKEKCQNEQLNPSSMEKISCMLEMLKKCEDDRFELFCEALKDLGQFEVAARLRDNAYRVGPRPSSPQVPNMTNYIKDAIDDGGTNSNVVRRLYDVLAQKYSFLHFIVFVYNDVHGFDYHCYSGSQDSVLHHEGRCAIVYYRHKPKLTDDDNPRYGPDDCEKVESIMRSVTADCAEQLHDGIKGALERKLQMKRNRDYWGLACISQAVPYGIPPFEVSFDVDLQYRLDPDIVYQFCVEKMGKYHCFIALC